MADNYLERRMEDLRSGKLRNESPSRPYTTPQKGYVRFPMPPRRVLVIGGCAEPYLSVVRIFLKSGCKVAVLDSDKATGERMAASEGIRFIAGDSISEANLKDAFQNSVAAWRDIDIIVTPQHSAQHLADLWMNHKDRFPIPSDYGGRLIVISKEENTHADSFPTEKYGITVNHISVTPKGSDEAVASLALFLSLPVSGCISGCYLVGPTH